MKYTEEEKKSLEFLIRKRDEAYGLMQFEGGELYQLAEEEFNNYLIIEEIIDKQQKEIEKKDRIITEVERYARGIKDEELLLILKKDKIDKLVNECKELLGE